MIMKIAVLNGQQRIGEKIRHIRKLHQHPIFLVGGVDTANLGRCQTHNRRRIARQYPEILYLVAVYVERQAPTRFQPVSKQKAPRADNEVAAIAAIGTCLAAIPSTVAGQFKLPLQRA